MNLDLSSIPVIDTHEHISQMYKWRPEVVGLLHILFENHYLQADMVAAKPEWAGRWWEDVLPTGEFIRRDGKATPAEEEEAMEVFIDLLPKVAFTSDWRAQQYALRDLFGLDDWLVTRDNWRGIDARAREKYRDRDAWHREVFERANIKRVFWCYRKPLISGLCVGAVNIGWFLDEARGATADSAALRARMEAYVDKAASEYEVVAIKIGTAYSRDLWIEPRGEGEVDAALSALPSEKPLGGSIAVSDFIHDGMVRLAVRRGWKVEVHTGFLAGNLYTHPMPEMYASRLEPFIARHPEASFDIFHGSFPQWGEAVALARRYPNVYLNFCWLPTLSESTCEAMLQAALDAVPVNKLMWGGDAHSPEMAYGTLLLFREILSRVLSRRAPSARLAHEAAEWILWRSASELYGISI